MEVIPEDEASGPSSTNNEAPRQIKNEVPVTPDWMMGTLSRELKQVGEMVLIDNILLMNSINFVWIVTYSIKEYIVYAISGW